MNKLELSFWWKLRRLRRTLRPPIVAWRHRDVSTSDVIIAEYPKSGRTWLSFMVGELVTGEEIDFLSQELVAPEIGHHKSARPVLPTGGRLLRTHEEHRREYSRAIYLVRHPADVAVSYYNWMLWVGWIRPTEIDFRDFFKMFLLGTADAYPSWAAHVRSWLSGEATQTLVVRYEEMHAQPSLILGKIAAFLEISATGSELERVVKNNSLERMKEKERQASSTLFSGRARDRQFVREGRVGGYRGWVSAADLSLMESVIGEEMSLAGYEPSP